MNRALARLIKKMTNTIKNGGKKAITIYAAKSIQRLLWT